MRGKAGALRLTTVRLCECGEGCTQWRCAPSHCAGGILSMGTEASGDPCHRRKGKSLSDKTPVDGPGYRPGRYDTT